MKRNSKFFILGLLLLLLLLPGLGAAAEEGVDYGDQVGYHPETGQVSFIGTTAGRAITVQGSQAGMMAQDQAMAILDSYAPLFGEDNPAANLVETSFRETPGQINTRYQQFYQGIPVLAGELVMSTTNDGKLISLAGELSPDLDLSVEPSISSREAAQTAVTAMAKYYGGEAADYTASDPALWIYDARLLEPSTRPQALVWRMEVTGMGDVPVYALVLIDAQRGGISLQFNQVDVSWISAQTDADTDFSVDSPSAYEFAGVVPKETYTANNGTTLPGTLLCDSADPDCTASTDKHAIKAHKYAGDTYAFYYDHHGRDSIDDAGMTLISTVRYDVNYCNAFWNGSQMVYGDGCGIAKADDVVAHEMTHGVTSYTSNLMYYYQSGAINESFSDVWGEFVDLTNGRGSDEPEDRWWLGEDVGGIGAIRNMQDPTIFGDPDKMTSPYYYLGADDLGGVHWNSGVNNKAVYLMTDGDSFNGYDISGIGIDKVAAIYYEVQTNLLTSGANYHALYYAVNQACTNLIGGAEGITAFDCMEVDKALLAVEMNQQPVADFNPEAGVCPAGLAPSYIWVEDWEGFSGISWWTTDVEDSYFGTVLWQPYYYYATSGVVDIWGLNADSADALSLWPDVPISLPTTANPLYMRFDHSYDFEWYDGGWYYDGGILEYSVDGGGWTDANPLIVDGRDYPDYLVSSTSNPYTGDPAFVGSSHGYNSSRYDISAFNGHTINFMWTVATDGSIGASGWDIDDMMIYECVAPAVPSAPASVTATDGTAPGKVEITWDAVPLAEWYQVYRDDVDTGATLAPLGGYVTYLGTEDETAVAEQVYYYWVEACNATGCSGLTGPDSGYAPGSLFWDDFETGDFSLWTRFNDGDGWLYPCAEAAMNGTWGACLERGDNDKRKQLIDETPINQTSFAARFNFDINGLSMSEGERFRFMQVKDGAERPFFIVLKYEAGAYWIQLNTLLDDLTKTKTGWYLLTDAPHLIEVNWQASSGPGADDGYATLWIDDFYMEGLTGLDNDTLIIENFKVGFTSRLVGKTISGIFYVDDVATSNTGHIGLP